MSYLLKFFLCGIFTSFLFPPFFILPIGFIIFPYFFLLISNKEIQELNKLKQFINGTFFGLGLNLFLLNWIKEPFLIDPLTANFSYLSYLLILYVSLFFGLAFVILSFFKKKVTKLILIPVIFVITEILREYLFYGFPWVTFALVASANYYFINIAYFIGTYGLSYISISVFLLPAIIILLLEKQTSILLKYYLFLFIFVLILFFTLIFSRLYYSKNHITYNEINFSLNQMNLSQLDKSNKLLQEQRFNKIIKTIENKEKDQIYLFSETDYPFIIKNDNIVKIFQKELQKNNSIVIGGIRENNNNFYNTLYFIDSDSYKFFDKKILVPFGEFLPFRKYLNFLEAIVGSNDFSSGKEKRKINIFRNFDFIPVICYEIIFLNNLINKVNINSPLLINLTNDAWFGKFSGPYQHFYLSRIRSVEFNKYLIRVSNNGISAIINNYGNILGYIPLNYADQYKEKLKVPISLTSLFGYHRFFYIILVLLFIICINIERKSERFYS